MTTKHTPGPWTAIRKGDDGAEVRAIASVAWCSVAAHFGPQSQTIDGKEAHANARLIAAAPDLLEALEDVLPYLEDARIAYGARAAIAKAKGETK